MMRSVCVASTDLGVVTTLNRERPPPRAAESGDLHPGVGTNAATLRKFGRRRPQLAPPRALLSEVLQ